MNIPTPPFKCNIDTTTISFLQDIMYIQHEFLGDGSIKDYFTVSIDSSIIV
jgi:hypothetical protein